jgi:hypothetical protein
MITPKTAKAVIRFHGWDGGVFHGSQWLPRPHGDEQEIKETSAHRTQLQSHEHLEVFLMVMWCPKYLPCHPGKTRQGGLNRSAIPWGWTSSACRLGFLLSEATLRKHDHTLTQAPTPSAAALAKRTACRIQTVRTWLCCKPHFSKSNDKEDCGCFMWLLWIGSVGPILAHWLFFCIFCLIFLVDTGRRKKSVP